jgi:drug/metabolite transporter (DMT)-like permease
MATHEIPPRPEAESPDPSGDAPTAPAAAPAVPAVPAAAPAAPAGGEAAAVRDVAGGRRLRRRLLALKTTIYALVAGCLCAIGLAIVEVTDQPVLAGVYVGLASVAVAGIGVCVTVYLHIRRKDGSGGDT